MSWYQITKTVKGRRYLYRQRSFRVAGKVRTESVYLGPADGGVAVTSAGNEGSIPIKAAAPSPEPVITTSNFPPIERSSSFARRTDLSQRALEREEERVRKQMAKQGLPTDGLPPLYLMEGTRVGRRVNRRGHFVQAAAKGQRNAFKRAYREALADRWLTAIKGHDPAAWNDMRQRMQSHQGKARWALTQMIFASDTPKKFLGVLAFLWSGQLPPKLRRKLKPQMIGLVDHEGGSWRDEACKVLGEMIQAGDGEKVFRKYEAAYNQASDRYWIELQAYSKMNLRVHLTGKAKQQARRVEKARIWEASCEAMQAKAETMWSIYWHGTTL